MEVTDIKDGNYHFNGGRVVWDAMGNLVTNGTATRKPAKAFFPAELAVGKKWHNAYEAWQPSGKKLSLYWDFHIQALETITVPAGTFKAFRVEGTSHASDGEYQSGTHWIDPERMLLLKEIYILRIGGQVQNSSNVMELASI